MRDLGNSVRTCRVAAVQLDLTPAPVEDRLNRMDAILASPAAKGAHLVVFPEMSITGYDLSPANFGRGETLDGQSVATLRELARRHDAHLVAGLSEVHGGRLFNTQVVVGPDGLCGAYRKRHVSSAENAIWHSGQAAGIVETDLGRIGIGICADMLFSTPWSAYMGGAVDLIASVAAWPDFRVSAGVPVRRGSREYHCRFPVGFVERLSAASGAPVVFANGSGPFASSLPVFGQRLSWQTSGNSRIAVGGQTVADDGGDAAEQVVAAQVAVGGRPAAAPSARRDLVDRLGHAELLLGEVTSAWLFRLLRPKYRRSAVDGAPARSPSPDGR